MQEKIWQPLGMEFPATWSLDSKKHGFAKMESGLNGRAIDFATFGSLSSTQRHVEWPTIDFKTCVTESTVTDPSDTRPWMSDQYWREAGGYYKYQLPPS